MAGVPCCVVPLEGLVLQMLESVLAAIRDDLMGKGVISEVEELPSPTGASQD